MTNTYNLELFQKMYYLDFKELEFDRNEFYA